MQFQFGFKTWRNGSAVGILYVTLGKPVRIGGVPIGVGLLGVPHQCVCGAAVHDNGIHGLSYRRNGGRAARYAEANDIIHRVLVSAGILKASVAMMASDLTVPL